MSKATIVTVSDGDTNDVSVINPAFTSWNSATAAIDGTNVREEGIGRRNLDFATDIFHKSFNAGFSGFQSPMLHGTPGTLGAGQVNIGGVVEVAYDLTGYQTTAGIVRCSFEYKTTTAPTGSENLRMECSLYYHNGTSYSILGTGNSSTRHIHHAIAAKNAFGPVLLLGNLNGKTNGAGAHAGKIGLFAYVVETSAGSTAPRGAIGNVQLSIDVYGG
jgi:hypothetical protein